RQAANRVTLGLLRLLEGGSVGAADHALLRLTQPMSRIQQEIDVSSLPTRELVQRPRGNRRLAHFCQHGRALLLARVLPLTREPLPLGDELVRITAVELVERFVERHSAEATAFAGSSFDFFEPPRCRVSPRASAARPGRALERRPPRAVRLL